MSYSINLTDYRMLYPHATGFLTLSQSGMLAALLEKRRRKAVRRALQQSRRENRRRAVRAWFEHGWAKLRVITPHPANPTLSGTTDSL